jgi:hypothetical protein
MNDKDCACERAEWVCGFCHKPSSCLTFHPYAFLAQESRVPCGLAYGVTLIGAVVIAPLYRQFGKICGRCEFGRSACARCQVSCRLEMGTLYK